MNNSDRKMREADDQLRRSRTEIAEAENVAVSTLARLKEQRETLNRTRSVLETANKDLSESNKTVDQMNSSCNIC